MPASDFEFKSDIDVPSHAEEISTGFLNDHGLDWAVKQTLICRLILGEDELGLVSMELPVSLDQIEDHLGRSIT